MPTYQYACTACEHRFDAVQSFTDAALTECPECSGRLRKLYGSVGVVFKGSGFYRNDSRSSAKANTSDAPKETSSSSGTDKSTATSTESKPTSSATSTTPPAAKAS